MPRARSHKSRLLRHRQAAANDLKPQAIFRRRRRQARRLPLARIRPGRPAPAMGPGTKFIAPNSPFISPLIPSVKKRVSGLPLLPPVPKPRAQRPPGPRHAIVNRDRAQEHPGCWIEDVDLAGGEAEIADQKVAAELTKIRWCQRDAPWRGEWAATAAVRRNAPLA